MNAERVAELGAQVRGLRKQSRLTQVALAARVGTSQSAIARLERGCGNPQINLLDRIAGATGARLALFFEELQ